MVTLKPFDIVVLEGRIWNPIEAPVMWRSVSKFSHCVVAHPLVSTHVVNPNVGGIKHTDIREYRGRRGAVCRYNGDLEGFKEKMSCWLLRTINKAEGYDYMAWLGFATGIKALEDENRWFCSELAYWLFHDNGIKLTRTDLAFPFPNLFYDHEDFNIVFEGRL